MYQAQFVIVDAPEPHPVTRQELKERAQDQVRAAQRNASSAWRKGDKQAEQEWESVAACFTLAAIKFGVL